MQPYILHISYLLYLFIIKNLVSPLLWRSYMRDIL